MVAKVLQKDKLSRLFHTLTVINVLLAKMINPIAAKKSMYLESILMEEWPNIFLFHPTL